jgi:alcohol dehydrogenase class IV
MPAVTICDPALTTGMPKFITAGTGMDALAHCLEAYCSPFYHPMSQGIALEGMRLVFENLPKVYAEPGNLEARAHMMSAAAMGAVAFQKGLGAIHSLSHPIGAVYGTHHGTTNAVVMPMVLDFNRRAIKDRLTAAAAYCGIKGGFKGFRQRIMDLRAELNIPENLTAWGQGPRSGHADQDGAGGSVLRWQPGQDDQEEHPRACSRPACKEEAARPFTPAGAEDHADTRE